MVGVYQKQSFGRCVVGGQIEIGAANATTRQCSREGTDQHVR